MWWLCVLNHSYSMSVCLFVNIWSVCLFLCLFLLFFLTIFLFILLLTFTVFTLFSLFLILLPFPSSFFFFPTCLFLNLNVQLFKCLFSYLFIYLFTCLIVYLFIFMLIYLFLSRNELCGGRASSGQLLPLCRRVLKTRSLRSHSARN